MRRVLLLPGWLESLRMYGDDYNLEVCIGTLDERSASADYIIGVSLGALVALKNIDRIQGKIILVNPPLPKRNIFVWFANWLRFLTIEGLFPERQKFTKNPAVFISTLIDCVKLLTTDFSERLDMFSKKRLTVIQGRGDRFFCDQDAVQFLNTKNIPCIEVDGGHNWCESIEKTINELTDARKTS